MTLFGYNDTQTLQGGQAAILQNIVTCNACPPMVMHDNLTSNIMLRGAVNHPCDRALYSVRFKGNIAVSAGGTAGEIQLAIYMDGAVRPLTIAAATPAAAEEFWNVYGEDVIAVPMGCCPIVYVANASVSETPATTPAPVIDVRNLQVFVDRVDRVP